MKARELLISSLRGATLARGRTARDSHRVQLLAAKLAEDYLRVKM